MPSDHRSLSSASSIDFLTEQINNEALAIGIEEKAEPFSFFIYESELMIAGCNGSVVYGMIYTDQLWVHPAHRQKGLGSELMEKVHALAKEKSCTMATVCTMSFQNARAFYEKLGYSLEFTRSGYAQNSQCYFLRKKL